MHDGSGPRQLGHEWSSIEWIYGVYTKRCGVFYGILKNRFRFCIGPIEAAFPCCTMIHNMILDFDKEFHTECSLWEGINWESLPSDISDEDIEEKLEAAQNQRRRLPLFLFFQLQSQRKGQLCWLPTTSWTTTRNYVELWSWPWLVQLIRLD